MFMLSGVPSYFLGVAFVSLVVVSLLLAWTRKR
jgi:hypothetical protein